MTKKSTESKTKSSFGNMGRALFYIIAIIVACCAVAVVLFETDAGLELVAKIRGSENSAGPKTEQPVETGNKKGASSREHKESAGQKTTKQDKTAEKNINTESSPKDTSSKVEDRLKQEEEKPTENKPSTESAGEEQAAETIEEETVMHERTSERESKDGVAIEIDEEGEPTEIPDISDNVDKQSWTTDDEGFGDDEDEEPHSIDESIAQQPGNEEASGEEQPFEAERETVEDRVDKEEGVLEPAGEQMRSDEDSVSVGDSLVEFEKETIAANQDKKRKEKIYIPEPEGPPIDEYPRQAQRGLRGDYGGKDCKDNDRNCKPWAEIGECSKNPIWMEVNCKKSCDVCGCSDNHVKCSEWAGQAECYKNAEYMNKNCMKSCGRC